MIAIDMPMPDGCIDCPAQYDGTCNAFFKSHPDVLYSKAHISGAYDIDDYVYNGKAGRPNWCPLIALNDKKEGATHE